MSGMLFPEGKRKAIIMSYDDGAIQDRRLVAMMNQYGVKGTFHLNSGTLDSEGKVTSAEVAELYAGHEVSAHTVSHPALAGCTTAEIQREVMDDRRALEALVGYPVRGLSYPFGSYNDDVIAILGQTGIESARTVEATHSFDLPEDFLAWHPTIHNFGTAEYEGMTAHQSEEAYEQFDQITQQFLNSDDIGLFYIWGHSWEFDGEGNRWRRIEEFFKTLSHQTEIHYATQTDLADYIKAYRNLRYSVDKTLVINPSAATVFIQAEEQVIAIPQRLHKSRESR